MLWKTVEYLTANLQSPSGYQLDHLHLDEVDGLIANLEVWFPEMKVSGERCHLTREFYLTKCQLKGQDEDRRIFPVVVKKDGKIVSLTTVEKDRDDLTVTARLGVVAPEHRGRGLGKLGPGAVETMGRGAGAELAYFFTTLRIPQEQILSEKCGFTLVGILPSSDREIGADGKIHRVPEAIYAKDLTGNGLFAAEGLSLTEGTRSLWDFLRRGAHGDEGGGDSSTSSRMLAADSASPIVRQ